MSEHKHNDGHNHVDERGHLVKCYHECKSQVGSLSFWVLMTLMWPLEHALFEHIPPFSWMSTAVHELAAKVSGKAANHDHDHDAEVTIEVDASIEVGEPKCDANT